MASMVKLSRFGKIAALSAAGGTFYLFGDGIRSYLKLGSASDEPIKSGGVAQEAPGINLEPKPIENLPDHVPYLLVGGGTASHSAMRAIRVQDPKARVLIVAGENHSPYMRPSLSKELWYTEKDLRTEFKFKWWNDKEKSIFFEIDEFYIPVKDFDTRPNGGVSLVKNVRLTHLDPDDRTAHLETGQKIKYDKCLLAPGGKPKSLPVIDSAPKEVQDRVLYFKTAEDFLLLDRISEKSKKIVIVGGGFLGSELTSALSRRLPSDNVPKDQVIYQIFPESGNLGKVLPEYLSDYVTKLLEDEGAQIIRNATITSIKLKEDKSLAIELSNGEIINADHIVCTVGQEPDVALAKVSGLEVDEKTGGYMVNSELEARSNVWVAGDAACFYDIKLGRRRVEHHDHAVQTGRLAGQNMTGAGKPYSHQSMFWSDIGSELSLEAVGLIDSSLGTYAVFKDPKESAKENVKLSSDKATDESVKEDTIKQDSNSNSDPGVTNSTKEKEIPYSSGIVFYLRDDIIVGILLWNLFGRLNIARRVLNEQKRYDDLNEVAKLFNLYLDE